MLCGVRQNQICCWSTDIFSYIPKTNQHTRLARTRSVRMCMCMHSLHTCPVVYAHTHSLFLSLSAPRSPKEDGKSDRSRKTQPTRTASGGQHHTANRQREQSGANSTDTARATTEQRTTHTARSTFVSDDEENFSHTTHRAAILTNRDRHSSIPCAIFSP